MAEKIAYKEIRPGDRIRFKWIDSQNRSEWHMPEELEALGLNAHVITEGIVFKRVKDGLLLYSSKSTDGQQYGGCSFVPRVCIFKKEIERL